MKSCGVFLQVGGADGVGAHLREMALAERRVKFEQPGTDQELENRVTEKLEGFVMQWAWGGLFVGVGAVSQRPAQQLSVVEAIPDLPLEALEKAVDSGQISTGITGCIG